MSIPQNILAKYRTYSYHHILIACDNEAAASYIRNSNRLSVFRDFNEARAVTIEEDKIVQLDTTGEADGKPDKVAVGNYVIIINGMIDTSFVIRDVEWFTTTAASTDQHDRHTSIAVEGKMTVEEPRGMRFMNVLNGACDLLQTDATGVIWMLKTIFVGHGINNNVEFSDHITDLRPLEYMMYDCTGTFDITGGVYEISFAGSSNGAARFPQFSRVAQNISFTPTDNLLSTSMAILEDNMNAQSEQNRTCVIEKLKEAYSEENVDVSALDNFRLVKYRIILESPYENSEYVIDGLTDQEKDTTTGEGPFKFGPMSTVEQAIRHIMDRCSRVKKDRTEGDQEKFKYSWKIHSEITMLGRDTTNPALDDATDSEVVLVVYRIRRHAEMSNKTVKRVLEGITGETEAVSQRKIKENLITFDYFFTGKNTDIVNFDLKMEMGLAFLQTIGSTNNIGTGTYQITGTESEDIRLNSTTIVATDNARGAGNVSQDGENKPKILIRSKTPIFPATNVNNVREKNIRGAHDTTLFSAMLSRHAALESVEAIVTIHGNPYLMSQTNRRSTDVISGADDDRDLSTIIQNWETLPALVKVNIFMPSSSATPSSTSQFNRVPFWYDGYFYLWGMDHKFAGGEFTQDLHILALPDESILAETQKTDITECGVKEDQDTAQSNINANTGQPS